MKTFSPGNIIWGLDIFAVTIATGTTALSGVIFYLVQKFQSEIYLWFIAGSVTAFITALGAVAVLRVYTAKPAFLPRTEAGYFEDQEKKTDPDHLRSQLILTGTARKLHHETVNFLNNIDLVVHGLKNETLSPGGSRIVRLLVGENERIKIYIQNYREVLKFSVIKGESRHIERIVTDVFLKWRHITDKPEIKARFNWQSHQNTVHMNTLLIREAFSILFDFMACSHTNGQFFKIDGRCEENNTTVAISLPDTGILDLENIDMFEPFTIRSGEDTTISKLFIARTIIEAHGGRICFKEDRGRKLTFQVSLPLFFEKDKENMSSFSAA